MGSRPGDDKQLPADGGPGRRILGLKMDNAGIMGLSILELERGEVLIQRWRFDQRKGRGIEYAWMRTCNWDDVGEVASQAGFELRNASDSEDWYFPKLGCPAGVRGCKWTSKLLGWDKAPNALWAHITGSSYNEGELDERGWPKVKLEDRIHPGPKWIEQVKRLFTQDHLKKEAAAIGPGEGAGDNSGSA